MQHHVGSGKAISAASVAEDVVVAPIAVERAPVVTYRMVPCNRTRRSITRRIVIAAILKISIQTATNRCQQAVVVQYLELRLLTIAKDHIGSKLPVSALIIGIEHILIGLRAVALVQDKLIGLAVSTGHLPQAHIIGGIVIQRMLHIVLAL